MDHHLFFSAPFFFLCPFYFVVVEWRRKEILVWVGWEFLSFGMIDLVSTLCCCSLSGVYFCFYLIFCNLWIQETQGSAVTSLYLLCCILRIVKIKDLANTVAASLFCPLEAFIKSSETKLNGYISGHGSVHETEQSDSDNFDAKLESGNLGVTISNLPSSSGSHEEDVTLQHSSSGSSLALR